MGYQFDFQGAAKVAKKGARGSVGKRRAREDSGSEHQPREEEGRGRRKGRGEGNATVQLVAISKSGGDSKVFRW